MAFDYGSIDLGIKNPFKLEGYIRALAGGVLAILGVFLLLSVQSTMSGGAREEAIARMVMGVALAIWGFFVLGRGLFQVFRFFVGRSIPANLAKNLEKSQINKDDLYIAYTAQQLEQMLQGRQNISFQEPDAWFSRLVHSIFPRLLYLPYAYRNLAQRLARALTQTIIALLCYGLAWFSGATNVTDVTSTPVMDWLSVILFLYLTYVWSQASPELSRLLDEDRLKMPGPVTLVAWIAGAILVPFALATFHSAVAPLPPLQNAAELHLLLILLLGASSAALIIFLLVTRAQAAVPVVEVAEFRDNWQESIHPQEIFVHFENIVMANRRYLEVPNRIYRGFDAKLSEQGSDDKGDFSGEMIQETQPAAHVLQTSALFSLVRTATTVVAALLIVVVGFMLFMSSEMIAAVFDNTDPDVVTDTVSYFGYLGLLAIFSRLLSNSSHAFWAEMQFESLIVYFQCQGTYTVSKLSTGTSIYDSTRSENVVVRSSITPWVIVTRAVSSTFTTSGAANLEQARYILEMHKAQSDLDSIMDDIRQFVSKRETIASINSEKDLAAASKIFQVNQQTRAQIANPGPDHPPVDQERISDSSGEQPLN